MNTSASTGTDGRGALSLPVLLLAAWTLLSLGITVNNGAYRVRAIVVVVVGLGFLLAAAARFRSREGAGTALPAVAAAAGASLAASLSYDLGLYGSGRALEISRGLSVLAAGFAVCAAVAGAGAWRARAAVAALASGAVAMVAMVIASPRPLIDVWFVLTEGSKRMVAGSNIFTGCWPGNTDPTTNCLYPYGPLTTVVQTPFRLVLGDVRYAYVVCLLVTAVLLWRLAGPRVGPALAALVLVSPKATFLLEQAWTEPLLLAGMAVMVWATLTGRGLLAVAGFAFALACKQHVVLLVPLAACWSAFGWRRTLGSVAAAGLFTLPWFLVDPAAFLEDTLFHIDIPPRLDSLSLYAAALNNGIEPNLVLVGTLTIATIAATAVLLPRTATGFVIGCAVVQYVFDLLNKQSFFNQWWFVTGLLLLAVATAAREAEAPEPQEVPPDLALESAPAA